MAEKRVIEYEAASELANDDWLLIDGVTEGTRKARPNVVTAELGAQVTNIATAVGGLTQVAMGHEQSFAPSYDESASYDVGDLVMQYNCLYQCTASTTGAWDAGKWARTEVSEQLAEAGKVDDIVSKGESLVVNRVADLSDMQDDIDSKQADTKIGGESILDNNKVANLDFLASYGVASGPIASFNDGATLPMPSLTVGIEAVQSGTGDPSPTNIRPITGWSAANVYRTGKNLFDASAVTIADITFEDSDSSTLTKSGFVYHLPAGSYSAKCFSENVQYYIYIRMHDKDGHYIDRVALSTTVAGGWRNPSFTLNDGDYIIVYAAAAGSTLSADNMLCIENDVSSVTEYVPYSGTTYTTALKDGQGNPMTVYGGECDVVNGTSGNKKTHGFVDMGTLNWSMQAGSGNQNARFVAPLSGAITSISLPLCSIYRSANDPVYGRIQDKVICLAGGNVYVEDNDYTSASAFKTAMNGAQLVYKLATPSTFTTQPTSIKSLEGVNNVWADSGDVLECKYVRDNSAVINDLIARVTALENA